MMLSPFSDLFVRPMHNEWRPQEKLQTKGQSKTNFKTQIWLELIQLIKTMSAPTDIVKCKIVLGKKDQLYLSVWTEPDDSRLISVSWMCSAVNRVCILF